MPLSLTVETRLPSVLVKLTASPNCTLSWVPLSALILKPWLALVRALLAVVWAVVTLVLVVFNWSPVTASVEFAATLPFARPLKVRTPSVPVNSTLVPPVWAPTVIAPVPVSWRTRPVLPEARSARPEVFAVVRPSRLVNASPTLLTVVPPTL